jgi:hypothetical protein
MIVKINFEETYELIAIASNLRGATFHSYDKNGNPILLKITVEPVQNPFMPNTYNLSFGPLTNDGKIDDLIRVFHQSLNKLFSTIILFCLKFLQKNPEVTIGLDGSSDTRAYLYHRMFCSNKDYLEEYFVALGIDWFLRLLRNGDYERHANGSVFFKPRPETFDYYRPARDLYRYYAFHLKNRKG